MTVPAADVHPVIRAAITALDSFGAVDRRTAENLLESWARRFQLSDSEVRAVLDHYPDLPNRQHVGRPSEIVEISTISQTGFDYSREPDNGAPVSVPPYVQGAALGGRVER